MRTLLTLLVALGALPLASPAFAEPVTFKRVMALFEKSATDRRLQYKEVDLVFDDGAQRMMVTSKDRPLNLAYENLQRVILEVSTQFRGGVLDSVLGAPTGIGESRRQNHWCYLEYQAVDGTNDSYLLEIDQEDATEVIERMQHLFGDRVSIPRYAENGTAHEIDKDILADINSNHDMKADKDDHPMPELLDDQALIVVVAPGFRASPGFGRQVKIHVDDHVEAVLKLGTYSFFYLVPGEYQLVSQAGNAIALQIAVEPGRGYYFLQYISSGGFRLNTMLTRHSEELVTYALNGAYHSVWSRKQ